MNNDNDSNNNNNKRCTGKCLLLRGEKSSDIFLMLCLVSIQKPVSVTLFLVNFTAGKRNADGLGETSSKQVTQLLKAFPQKESFIAVAKHMEIKSK